jgi:hypothetical protein
VRAETPVEAPAPVAGGIPGFDRTGQEVIAGTFRVNDAPLSWDLHGRCGFATDFAYSSHDLMRRGRSGAAVRWLLALLVSTDRAGNITVSGSKTQGTTQLPPAPTADLPALRRRLESEALPTPGRHLATVTCPSSSTSTSAAAPDKVARQATAGR